MKLTLASLSLTLSAGCLFSLATFEQAHADKVCIRLNNAGTRLVKRVVSTGNCPGRFIEVVDTSLLAGPQGPSGSDGDPGEQGQAGPQGPVGDTGAEGADGVIRVWGDGSGGALDLSGVASIEDQSLQLTSLNIQEATSVTVQSGTVIRATGQCTIAGTISVFSGAGGGFIELTSAITIVPAIAQAHPGRSYYAAGHGELGPSTATVEGGRGGESLTIGESRRITTVGTSTSGGGGGGPGLGNGGAGGGVFALYCQGGIVVTATGTISATGGNAGAGGGGGGAGGMLILASTTSIENLGSLVVTGGSGGASNTTIGNGGGGGGGIVHALAPTVSLGTTLITGGAAGETGTAVTATPRFGGAGGGALGGRGGAGASVATNADSNTLSGAASGGAGIVVMTEGDPSSLLL